MAKQTQKDKEVQLDVLGPEEHDLVRYNIPGYKRIGISRTHLSFLNQLRDLTPTARIMLMGLDDKDLLEYIRSTRQRLQAKLLGYFEQEWRWRVTAEVYDFKDASTNEQLFGVGLERTALLSRIRRGILKNEQLHKILDAFDGERSELYKKEADDEV